MPNVDRRSMTTQRVEAWACAAAAMAALIALPAGCVKPAMPVPEELVAVSEELPVTGRSRFGSLPGVGESFHIGPYEIAAVGRDSQVSFSGSLPGFAHTDISGGYSFLFQGGGEQRRAECAFAAKKRVYGHGAPVSVRRAGGTLGCVCRGNESESDLTVSLSYDTRLRDQKGQWLLGTGRTSSEDQVGELRAGGRSFGLRMISTTEGMGKTYVAGEGWKDSTQELPFKEPTGCLVYGEGLEAGLELLHPGRVWLARSLESGEREEMACLLGGLLLYRAATER